jgi:ParB-like chromosome segregation protein Spo0J
MSETLRLADIIADHPAKYQHIVEHYVSLLRADQPVRPILVSRSSSGRVVVVDGHHRYFAALAFGQSHIECLVWSIH